MNTVHVYSLLVCFGIIVCMEICSCFTERYHQMSLRELSLFSEEEYEANVFQHDKLVVCYVQQPNIYSKLNHDDSPIIGHENACEVQNIDPKLCTHLVYAFGNLDRLTFKIKATTTPKCDHALRPGPLQMITQMKKDYPHLKILLSLGGSNCEVKKLTEMASKAHCRQLFIKSVLETLRRYKFDGLDVYFPNNEFILYDDMENFIKLFEEIKEAFGPNNFIITAAFGTAQIQWNGFQMKKMGEILNYVNLISYDYNKPSDKFTSHSSPLPAVQQTVDDFISIGIPADKLVLGLSFYGRAFRLVDKTPTRSGAAFGLPTNISYYGRNSDESLKSSYVPYHKILKIASSRDVDVKLYWDDKSKVSIMRKNKFWVSFDNPKAINDKVEIVSERRLGGAMIRFLHGDDFLGFYDYEEEKYPLLKKVNHALSKTRKPARKNKFSEERESTKEVPNVERCSEELSRDCHEGCGEETDTPFQSELPTREAKNDGNGNTEDSSVWTFSIRSNHWKGVNITLEF